MRPRRGAQGRRPLRGQLRRRGDPALRPRLPAARVLLHEGRHRGLRQPAGPTRTLGPGRSGRRLLARVRPGRQGDPASPLPPLAPGGAARHRSHADTRGGADLGPGDRRPRRAGSVLGAGDGARVPRAHLRLSRRRGGAAHQRPLAWDLLRRGGGGASRPRILHRAPRRARAPGLPRRGGADRGGRPERGRLRVHTARAAPSTWVVRSGTGPG